MAVAFFYPQKAFRINPEVRGGCPEKRCRCLGITKKGLCPFPCEG